MENRRGSPYLKHLASSSSQPQLYHGFGDHQQQQRRPHSDHLRRFGRGRAGTVSSGSSREASPTKLYYKDSHSAHSTNYGRPSTSFAPHHGRFAAVHHSVPDLYGGGGGPRPRTSNNPVTLSSRRKRTSFETLPPGDDDVDDYDPDMEEYEISTDVVHHKTLIQIPGSPAHGRITPTIRINHVNKSHETLSNIVRNGVGLSSSLRDLQKVGTMPTKRKKMPPIRQSKGVMQILTENVTSSKIPRRQSLSESSKDRMGVPFSRTQARGSRRGSVMVVAEEATPKGRSKTPTATPRRQSVSRPTTLSPIIGTPNKDSELSGTSERDNVVVPDSPSRIPIRSRSNSRATGRGTRDESPRKSSNREGGTHKVVPNAPILRKTPIAVTSNLHRANPAKKNTPVFGSLNKKTSKPGISAQKAAPGKKVTMEKKSVKRNSSLRSDNSSPIDEPRRSGGGSRQPSPSKSPSPMDHKRGPSPANRGPSPGGKKDASPAKRGPSPMQKRADSPAKGESSPEKAESPKEKKKLKKVLSKESFQSKSSDSLRKKTLEKKNSFKKQQSNPDLIPGKKDEDGRSINSMASAISIIGVTKAGEKFKKLVPLTKQNVVSMTTAAVVSQPAQIQTTLTNQLSQAKMADGKKNSEEGSPDPAAIIEQSQKTLESIQKTMTDATEEVNKTIEENLSHLKDLQTAISDSPKPADKDAAAADRKPHPMLTKEGKTPSSRDLLKKRMESGTPKMGTPKSTPKATPSASAAAQMPTTPKPAMPVEPTVNVIEKPVGAAAPAAPTPQESSKQSSAATATTAKMPVNEQAAAAAPPPTKPEVKLEGGKADGPMMNRGSTQQLAHNAHQKSSTTMGEAKREEHQPPAHQPKVGEGGGGGGQGVGQSANNNNGGASRTTTATASGGVPSSLAAGQTSKLAPPPLTPGGGHSQQQQPR